MEKYEFEQKLKEAVLIKKDNKPTVLLSNGEEVGVCCPELCSMNISENGSPCLVSVNKIPSNEEYAVVAFSLDNPNRENKDWICIKPIIFKDAVEFFLTNFQMEGMVSGCKAVNGKSNKGKTEPDFAAGDAYIELNVPDAILNAADGGWFQIKSLLLTAEKIVKFKNLIAELINTEKRIIFLTVFQHDLNDKMWDLLCRELSRFFGMDMNEKTEFWVADMKLREDGITLVSCQNITGRVLLE